MCVVLHSLNQLILQMDQLRHNTEEDATRTSFTDAGKPLFPLGYHVPFSSFWERTFRFPYSRSHPGHSFSFGWVPPECFLYRVLQALRPRRFPVVLSCREGGSCGPMAPSRGDAQDDSLLLKVRSPLARNGTPLLGSWALIQAKQLYVWSPTCAGKNGHARQICSMWGLHPSTADKASHARLTTSCPCFLRFPRAPYPYLGTRLRAANAMHVALGKLLHLFGLGFII